LSGIIILDHLFGPSGAGEYVLKNLGVLRDVDAIEVYNGEMGVFGRGVNERVENFYKKHGECSSSIGALSVSDGHSLSELGSSWTEINPPKLGENFVFSFGRSVRATSLWSKMKKEDSYRGSVEHIVRLAGLVALDRVSSVFR
jgi:hypothetical protein